jgi:hypothetical protein
MPLRGKARRGGDRSGASADKDSPDFWRAVKGGDFVTVSDAEAFAASLAGGGGASEGGSGGLDYEVGEIRTFALRGPDEGPQLGAQAMLGEYRFIELRKEGSGPLYLALVDIPERFELRLYFIPAGVEPGTRDDYIDRGDAWLFLPPPNPDDFISSELEYAPFPDLPPIEEGGNSRKLIFARVGSGSLFAESRDGGTPVIITEYQAASPEGALAGESAPENPLLLVLEEGWMRRDGSEPEEGGYMTVMLGKVMRTSDLDSYPS